MPPSPAPASSVLQSFRGEVRVSASLHPLETALLAIVGTLLCFMPWALGTMHVWSQFVGLGLAAAAFAVALVNRRYEGDLAPQGDFRLIMWIKLVRFPFFWVGLAFMGYVVVQGLNPSWIWKTDGVRRWLESADHISWLPTSIDAPYSDMNAWRTLVIGATAWLVVCALWTGVTRRVTIQRLLAVAAINGALFAIVGILQKVTGATHILWGAVEANNTGNFFSTIIYKNHAGAYLNLVLMLCVAMLYWHFTRAERRMDRSSPAPLYAFLAVILGLGVLLTQSRAATILLLVFTVVAFTGFIIRSTLYRGEGRSPWAIVVLCVIFALFVGLGSYFLNAGQAFGRLGKLIQDGRADSSVFTRTLARKATLEMAGDRPVTGWGAGSFRHYFPVYQRAYPEIRDVAWNPELKLRWSYAHNDYVQLLAEFGFIGAAFLLTLLAGGVRHLVRHRVWERPHIMFVLFALAVTAAHAWVDFPSHNPAILVLWWSSAALACRWAELEAKNAR